MTFIKSLKTIKTLALKQSVNSIRHSSNASLSLLDVLCKNIPKQQKDLKAFIKENGKKKVGEITLSQVFLGMRGMLAMVWETSELDPNTGIEYRGLDINQCRECLPKPDGAKEPFYEALIWFMMTGEIPTQEQCLKLSEDMKKRQKLPKEAEDMLKALPRNMRPMLQYSTVMTAMSAQSHFYKAYKEGTKKNLFWYYTYEDALDLIARAPILAGKIYRRCTGIDDSEVDTDGDMACIFGRLLCDSSPDFVDFLRLYLLLHCDHEGGNVIAHTTHLVGSALSDGYLSHAAGINGLAGPLHGLAAAECFNFVQKMMEEIGEDPTDDEVKNYVQATLDSGKVIPGYGHAVLRKTDPRFTAQLEFAQKLENPTPAIVLVCRLFQIVPEVLQSLKKVSNPWPNVDAHSGALFDHFGIKNLDFYTVMFGVARSVGVMSNLIWARSMALPIERPKSLNTTSLKALVAKDNKTDCK